MLEFIIFLGCAIKVKQIMIYFRIMQACCDVAFNYAHVREQFGTKIGEFQVNTVFKAIS